MILSHFYNVQGFLLGIADYLRNKEKIMYIHVLYIANIHNLI